MSKAAAARKFREEIAEAYARRFPASLEHLERFAGFVLDDTSHAIRWNEPFMPIVRRTNGATVSDLDGHCIVDYWQGHFANILGHNPAPIREALAEALSVGQGLQSGMLHEVEAEMAEWICRCTSSETVRFTTSGSLGTFYATLLSRAFTGRDRVLKVAGGWHGSQPFGLKGVSPHGDSFDRIESEGLSSGAAAEIIVTRFNDIEELRGVFERSGDRIACFLIEPVLGQGGGIPASVEYLREARRLTEKYGALLLCDEIITGFRYRAGDLSSLYGVRPDLIILGKVLGGGMPVAAVAGRRDVLGLCSRKAGRVKFEGGTYSGHELSLIAARALLRILVADEEAIYRGLAERGERTQAELMRIFSDAGINACLLGTPCELQTSSSLVMLHVLRDGAHLPQSPEELHRQSHPHVTERLLKSILLLEDVSVRSGLGAVSTAHDREDLERTLEGFRSALDRLRRAGLV